MWESTKAGASEGLLTLLTLMTQQIFDKKFAPGPPPSARTEGAPYLARFWPDVGINQRRRIRRAFDAYDAFDAHSFYGESSSYRQLRATGAPVNIQRIL
jgi:hypothetical protein